jgi:hypothetical protein
MYKPTPYFVAGIATAIFVFGALFALKASADDTLRWVHPTEYTDASALNAADIQATVVRVFATATSTQVLQSILVERALDADPNLPPPLTVVVPRAAPTSGSTVQCYDAATLMKVSAGGQTSAFAPDGRVCKTVNAPAPKRPRRPTNVSVQ